jgi:hypothetical protein
MEIIIYLSHVLAETGKVYMGNYYLQRKLLFTLEIIIYLSHVLAEMG